MSDVWENDYDNADGNHVDHGTTNEDGGSDMGELCYHCAASGIYNGLTLPDFSKYLPCDPTCPDGPMPDRCPKGPMPDWYPELCYLHEPNKSSIGMTSVRLPQSSLTTKVADDIEEVCRFFDHHASKTPPEKYKPTSIAIPNVVSDAAPPPPMDLPVPFAARNKTPTASQKMAEALKEVQEGDDFYDAAGSEEELEAYRDPVPELGLYAIGDEPNIPELEGHQEGVPWTVDSGAAEPVANPKHFPDCVLEPSPGSLSGQTYVGPGPGSKIPNLGQLTAKRMLGNGLISSTRFQGADVRKPLLAVSALNDKGNPVWFDQDQTGGSYIIPRDAPELAEIRKLIQQIKTRVKLDRKGGTFQLRNWQVGSSSKGFHRQVKP